MIHPDSRTYDWINNVAISNGVKNKSLAEKTIRAFSLLEALVRSGCPLIFKGGTSLMLHLNSAKRLSIDVDIICPPGTPIENFLYEHAEEYGFGKVELLDRKTRLEIPKKHAKYHYQVAYPSGHEEDKILLDVLFEDNHYSKIVSLPIQSPFLKMEGDSVFVKIPSHEDLLGDKLTAFAPHTTGIPFFKGEKDCSMEINKQLFDIASLFDLTNDISVSMQTFKKFADIELQYRNKEDLTINDVLKDIFNTSRCISLRGVESPDEFKLLQQGINKVKSFIHSENYSIESAVVNSAKAAYLSKLIELGITEVNHFDPSKVHELSNANIVHPLLSSKFNKYKKSNIEAFYYWNEIQKLL